MLQLSLSCILQQTYTEIIDKNKEVKFKMKSKLN